jgi:hypothetical protein
MCACTAPATGCRCYITTLWSAPHRNLPVYREQALVAYMTSACWLPCHRHAVLRMLFNKAAADWSTQIRHRPQQKNNPLAEPEVQMARACRAHHQVATSGGGTGRLHSQRQRPCDLLGCWRRTSAQSQPPAAAAHHRWRLHSQTEPVAVTWTPDHKAALHIADCRLTTLCTSGASCAVLPCDEQVCTWAVKQKRSNH